MEKYDFRKLQWANKPALYLISEDQAVLETEPFTSTGNRREHQAAELVTDVQNSFVFEICVEEHFNMQFDECGVILYNGKVRSLILGMKAHNDMTNQLRCTVFHDAQGDVSIRELGTRIEKMYYRIWHRANMVRIQYSFNGDHWNDLRKYWLAGSQNMQIGLYACSPLNSSFDAVFRQLILEEGDGK